MNRSPTGATAAPVARRKKGPGFWNVVLIGGAVALGVAYHAQDLDEKATAVPAPSAMDRITHQVARDAITQYEITKKHGSPMDRCVYAGAVLAAVLQAKDEAAYASWKPVEANDCHDAGLQR